MNKPFITQAQLALYKYQSDRQSQEETEKKPKINNHQSVPTLPMSFKKLISSLKP
ncbi:phage associated protein [Neisseria meningitidis]|nr:phage associated protein [Neisseria meningitidis]